MIGRFLLLIRLASNQTPVSDVMQSLAGVFVGSKVDGLCLAEFTEPKSSAIPHSGDVRCICLLCIPTYL